MRLAFRFVGLALLALAGLTSCHAEAPLFRYAVALRVSGAHGAPLAGARVSVAGEPLGSSGEDGLIRFELWGREGEERRLALHCPEGHTAAEPSLGIRLRRFSDDSAAPEYAARCVPLEQQSVVIVRADDGPNLPIQYLGRVVARTDASGAAHFILETPPGETIELGFDTRDSPRLRPQNPSARFRVSEADDVLIVNQSFSLLPPRRVARHRPQRLRSAR